MIFDILGEFDNTLTGDDKYRLRNCENLRLSIQMQLSNENYFLRFLCHVWHLHEILNILKKKMIVMANLFPKLKDVKDLIRPLSKKRRFRTPFCQ